MIKQLNALQRPEKMTFQNWEALDKNVKAFNVKVSLAGHHTHRSN
jgi:hypothetical protein